jgi:hypothetical protein
MVIGYWDIHGFSSLIPGDSTTQTDAVNQAIASIEHYNDYALPLDNSTTGLLKDKSQFGGAHADNCLADFMETSRSNIGLLYGWTYIASIDDGLLNYTDYINEKHGTSYEAASTLYYYSWFSFSVYKTLIDRNIPLVLIVDYNGDGNCDHAVAAVGYRETNGYPEYACWDTKNTESLRWEKYQEIANGKPWGIYEAFSFTIVPEPMTFGLLLIGAAAAILRRMRY